MNRMDAQGFQGADGFRHLTFYDYKEAESLLPHKQKHKFLTNIQQTFKQQSAISMQELEFVY